MAATKISNIIVPEVFVPYVKEKTAEKSALIKSGIVVPDKKIDELAQSGGKTINMPFFKDLDGDDEVLTDTGALTPAAISTGQDVAVLLMRGKAWGVNDLAEALSGADPMGAIGDLVSDYWARKEQTTLIKTLTGVFADNVANDSSDHVHDLAIEDGNNAQDANLIGSNAVIDGCTLMGDSMGKLAAIAMHSVVYARLLKLNLIDTEPTNTQNIGWGVYLGKTVIVDDNCPRVAGSTSGYKYTSYLFGYGAFGRGEGNAPVPVETDRDSLAGENYLISRRHYILHPRGIKFTSSSVAGASPTNAELANAANWDRVYEPKNIRLVSLVTNG